MSIRFDEDASIETMSSEELERYIEARLRAIETLWEKCEYRRVLWHVHAAQAACARWRHVGIPIPLFDAASVAPTGPYAVTEFGA